MESVNFQDLIKAAGDAGFTLIPKGWYDVVVDKAEAGETSTGKPRVRVFFRIISGPYAATAVKIRNDFNLTADNANALAIWFRHMEAMGLPQSWFAQLPPGPQIMQYVAQALLGRQARIQVTDNRIYGNRPQNDVVDVQPPFGAPSGMPAQQPYTPAQAGIPQVPQVAVDQPYQHPAYPQAPSPMAIPQPGYPQQDEQQQQQQQQQQFQPMPQAVPFQPPAAVPAPGSPFTPPQSPFPQMQPGVPQMPQQPPAPPQAVPQPPQPGMPPAPPQLPQQAPTGAPAYQPPQMPGQPPQQQQVPPPPPPQQGNPGQLPF